MAATVVATAAGDRGGTLRLHAAVACCIVVLRPAGASTGRAVDGLQGFRVGQPYYPPLKECNDGPEFCDLPLSMYTFAGTHGSNLYNLTTADLFEQPKTKSARCAASTQLLTTGQQLKSGIRYLKFDMCAEECGNGAAALACRNASISNGFDLFYGQPLMMDLMEVAMFVQGSPRQVVVISPGTRIVTGNASAGRDAESLLWLDQVRVVFGDCADLDAEQAFSAAEQAAGDANPDAGDAQAAADDAEQAAGDAEQAAGADDDENADDDSGGPSSPMGLSCAFFPKDPRKITMRKLVASELRVLVMRDANGVLPTGSVATASGDVNAWEPATASFMAAQMVNERSPNQSRLFELQVYMSGAIWEDRTQDDGIICNHQYARRFNSYYFPAEDRNSDSEKRYQVDSGAECDSSCGCLGYMSVLETWHQHALDSGFNVLAVTADYPEQAGHLVELTRRINKASLRRIRGELEPGFALADCPGMTGVYVGAGVAPIAVVVGAYLLHRRRLVLARKGKRNTAVQNSGGSGENRQHEEKGEAAIASPPKDANLPPWYNDCINLAGVMKLSDIQLDNKRGCLACMEQE